MSFASTVSMMRSPHLASALELVPEIYYLPEILTNLNFLNFSTEDAVPPVALPPWSKSPAHFVYKMRQALESSIVSSAINEWIDLVWGFRRTGKAAEERCNAFSPSTFEFHPEDHMNDPVLLRALTDQIDTCGIAPRQLFTEPHEPRRCCKQYGYCGLRFDCCREPSEKEKHSLRFDFRHDRWLKLHSRLRIRILGNAIEFIGDKSSGAHRFRPEIQPTLVYTSRDSVVTAHALPFVVLWLANAKTLVHVETLTGHLNVITALFVNVQSMVILAGHCDGSISVFAMAPSRFLRVVECELKAPVTMVRVLLENADILAIQEIEGGSRLSLFSVNGESLAGAIVGHRIRDCLSTSFPTGTKKNIIIMLTVDGNLVVLSARTLKSLYLIQLQRVDNASLFIFRRNDVLFVTHLSMHVTLFSIVPEPLRTHSAI
jgi:hypothetical protein